MGLVKPGPLPQMWPDQDFRSLFINRMLIIPIVIKVLEGNTRC